MKEDLFLIEEIAQRLGITKRTIRYYEEQGLLNPTTRTEKGYRLYSEDDIGKLERIIELRDVMGFSLKDIKEIIEVEENISQIASVYKNKKKPDREKETLLKLKGNMEFYLELIGKKINQLQSIDEFYRDKLQRVEIKLRELE